MGSGPQVRPDVRQACFRTGTLVRVWRKVSSLKLAKTWLPSRKITKKLVLILWTVTVKEASRVTNTKHRLQREQCTVVEQLVRFVVLTNTKHYLQREQCTVVEQLVRFVVT